MISGNINEIIFYIYFKLKNPGLKVKFLIVAVCILLVQCRERRYATVEVHNPVFRPNSEFRAQEDLSSPKFSHLVDKYRPDTVFHGERDEFKRILLLRHWIRSVIAINDHGDPYPGGGYAEGILDAALKGQGFHCGHFMTVQNAVMNAFGYVTRTLGAGPGVKGGPDGHHGANEIWVNQYHKWFLSDAKYDHHFEKNGIPLSALEVRNEYLKNKAADIVLVKGPDRIPIETDPENGITKEQYAQTFTWIEWHGYNDMFTDWPDYTDLLIMYNDDYFKNHTWIWDGHPHWAYAKPEFMKLVDSEDSIYWTPNTISSGVKIEGNIAHIKIISDKANLKEYQMKIMPEGEWRTVNDQVNFRLGKDKYEFLFRAVNVDDMAGPENKVIIQRN